MNAPVKFGSIWQLHHPRMILDLWLHNYLRLWHRLRLVLHFVTLLVDLVLYLLLFLLGIKRI